MTSLQQDDEWRKKKNAHKHSPVTVVADQRNTGTEGVRKMCECGFLMTVWAPYEHRLLEMKQIEITGGILK